MGHYLAPLAPLYLLTEITGNVGDQLIWRGVDALLSSTSLHAEPITAAAVDGTKWRGGTLIVPGGGGFHQHWHDQLPGVVIRASATFDRVVVLASSFDLSVDVVATAVALVNVYCFARDATSYQAIAPFGRAVLAPDVAIFDPSLAQPELERHRHGASEAVLVALRTDAASTFVDTAWRPSPTQNRDISLVTNTVDEFLACIDGADEVVTNRLHVAIASVLRGRRLRYINPYDQKISQTLAVAVRDCFGDRIEQVDLEWLVAREYVVAAEPG